MKKNFIPLALIIAIFAIVPALFWVLTSRNSSNNVQGANTGANVNGVAVKIDSQYGNWDLVKYLCKTKEECSYSLVSGKALDTTSGGAIKSRDINIEYSEIWKDYSFLKLFVRSGWGSQLREFRVSKITDISDMSVQKMTYGGVDYNVVILPIKDASSTLLRAVSFSDL